MCFLRDGRTRAPALGTALCSKASPEFLWLIERERGKKGAFELLYGIAISLNPASPQTDTSADEFTADFQGALRDGSRFLFC